MRKISAVIVCMYLSFTAFSQDMILHDPVSARVFSSTKYSGISGSPFLKDDWTMGSVATSKGIYSNLQLKLDAYSNILYFNKDDSPYEFTDQIISFVLTPVPADSASYLRYRKGLTGSGIRSDQYVQVLAQGKISLYRLDSKLLTEVNQINQGLIKSFTNTTRYYVMKDGSIKSLKLGKSDILDLMSDKSNEVQAFVSANNISFRKDADVVKLFNYYNSL